MVFTEEATSAWQQLIQKMGKKYELAGWSSDGKQMILTDGTQLSYNRGTITNADGTTTKVSII